MKKFLSFLGASLFALGFVGCSNELDNSKDLLLLQSAASKSNISSSSKTGSFTYESQESRSISVSDIKSAKVTLTGYDSNGNNFSKSSDLVAVSGGKGTNISVSEVPVADNVVVTVQSYSDDKGTVQVAGGVIRSVVKISSGPNSGSVDWATSRKGNIYNALYEGGVNTNTLSSSYVSSIETLVGNLETAKIHANLIDVEKILSIVKSNGSLSPVAADYKIATGTVTATVYGYSGKSVQIADPASSAQTAGADGSTLTFVDVLPGTWNVYADGEKVKTIKVSAGNNDVTIGNPYSGHMVVYVSASSAPRLWIWQVSGSYTDGKDVLGCDWNSRPTMAAADGMCNNNGWYMYDLTANNCNFTSGIAFNIILNDNGNVETGKTATFWYDAAGSCGTAGAFYDSDPTANQLSSDATLSSISVNGTAISGFAAGTTTYTSSISASTTSAAVTAVANDSAATVSVSPDGSASIASGSSQVFTITVTAEDGTTNTYTVTVKRAVENDTTLASITVNGKAASISGTTATAALTGTDDSLSITSIVATAADSNATATPSATTETVADGASKTFTITVTNGGKTATYTLTVSHTKKAPSAGQYGTNDKGYGVNKTISSWSDWTEAMQIARGAAYDDPRTWKGHQETAYDAYALYAAYDDTNLYLMVELTNLPDGRATFMNHSYAGSDNAWWDNRDCPLGFIINTGKGAVSTSPTVSQNGSTGPIWGAINFTDSEGFDFLFYGSSKYGYADHKSAFVGVGTPGFFKLNKSTGYFSYDSDYCLSANSGAPGSEVAGTSGISVRYIRKCQVSSKVKFESSPEDNRATSGQTGEDLMASETYTEVETNDLDMSYWYTIPLATLGVDKVYIESKGIGVRQLTPNGGSLMDCLPWDPCMVDVATESCSDDESTSKEKEDVDNITSAQARVGR
ncbi:MAG: cadherin-like beta sandwich domain-containing protein [Treponema sp.]|nr:cadherin-like beta sandwich domain-containing protein [Treponema sp.]